MLVALTAMTYNIPIVKISILIAMCHPICLSRSMLKATYDSEHDKGNESQLEESSDEENEGHNFRDLFAM